MSSHTAESYAVEPVEEEVEAEKGFFEPTFDAGQQILRASSARNVPAFSFGNQEHTGTKRPAWSIAPEDTLQVWQPGLTPRPAPLSVAEAPPEEDYEEHDDEYDEFDGDMVGDEEALLEESQEFLMGAAAHLEKVYEETRAEASQLGYEEGLERGREEGAAEAKEEVASEIAELQETCQRFAEELEDLKKIRKRLMVEAEEQSVQLALAVGERLAKRSLLQESAWVEGLIKEAVEALTDGDRVTCKISPELGQKLRDENKFPQIEGTFEMVEELGPLDLIVESHCGRVDASFAERLEQLSRAVSTRVSEVDSPPVVSFEDKS